MEPTAKKQEQLTNIGRAKLIHKCVLNIGLWLIFSALLGLVLVIIDYFVYFARAIQVTMVISIIGFNLATADVLRHCVKRHQRSTVAWTTAIILFSPFLAAIAYFLTFPKGQKLAGLGKEEEKRVVAIERFRVRPLLIVPMVLVALVLAATWALVVTNLYSPRYTADQVINLFPLNTEPPLTRSLYLSAKYEGFGKWLVTFQGGRKVELIFHESTGTFRLP